ncbi:hypothetical protein [Kocuria sp. U4B]
MCVPALIPLPAPSPAELLPPPAAGDGAEPDRSAPSARLGRYRVRADRAGPNLRAGELVLCVPYEPVALGLVVLVRCEADGHRPGVLLPAEELEYLEPAHGRFGPCTWDEPGVRP